MTRFTRAKGSKASNEKLPNEATPWHVMKQQLHDTLTKDENSKEKIKSAKQLLSEKEEPYYANSFGNLNNDWAEFEDLKKDKTFSKKQKLSLHRVENEKIKKPHCNVKTKKEKGVFADNEKLLENVSQSVAVTNNIKNEHEDTADSKQKKNKRKQNFEETNSVEPSLETDKKIKKQKKEMRYENQNGNKFVKEKVEQVASDQMFDNLEKHNSNFTENNSNQVPQKLSKRQKRNLKKRNQHSNNTENVMHGDFNANSNNCNTGDFNQQNNDGNKEAENRNVRDNEVNKVNGTSPAKHQFTDKRFVEDKQIKQLGSQRIKQNIPNRKMIKNKPPKIRDDKEHKRRKPDIGPLKITINGVNLEIVKYDGFPVRKEDADRLKELRHTMVLKGIPKSEIDAAMKLERRKAEKVLARIRKQVCFHCRKSGHNLSDCPELSKEENGTGICFKCGSTEHTHFECKVTKSDDYRYAMCFICRERGHVAKQCPDNPKGLYPQGGCCKTCGDVTHLMKDCPDVVKKKEEKSVTVNKITNSTVESLDEELSSGNRCEVKSNRKIIKF